MALRCDAVPIGNSFNNLRAMLPLMRRRVYSPGAPDADGTCPHCGNSFSWVSQRDLRPVHIQFRCASGHQPTSELTCRDCGRVVIAFGAPPALHVPAGQESLLLEARDADRAQAVAAFENGSRRDSGPPRG